MVFGFKTAGKFLKAAETGDMATIQRYLNSKSNAVWLAARDKIGNSALHIAVNEGHLPVITALLDAGMDANLPGSIGQGAIYGAAQYNRSDVMRLLLERKADPNTRTRSLCCPIHWTSENGDLACTQMLVEAGADMNAKNAFENCYTPLHGAVSKRRFTVVEYLLQKGARTDITDKNGKTPSDLAEELKFTDILMLFEKYKTVMPVNTVTTGPDSVSPVPDTTAQLRREIAL